MFIFYLRFQQLAKMAPDQNADSVFKIKVMLVFLKNSWVGVTGGMAANSVLFEAWFPRVDRSKNGMQTDLDARQCRDSGGIVNVFADKKNRMADAGFKSAQAWASAPSCRHTGHRGPGNIKVNARQCSTER